MERSRFLNHRRDTKLALLRFVDRNGTQVSEFKFSIPGASLINIHDNSVALGVDESLAIAGTAYSDDSRAGMFVAWVSRTVKSKQLYAPPLSFRQR